MSKKPRIGRPPTGHTERMEARMSPELAKLIRADAERLGIKTVEWLRRSAHLTLSQGGLPAVEPEGVDE